MARATRGRKAARPTPYDPDLLDNWTLTRLKDECKRLEITFPSNARRAALIRLLKEHKRDSEQAGDSPDLPTLSQDAPRSTGQDGGREVHHLELIMNNVLDALGTIGQRLDALEKHNSTPTPPAVPPPPGFTIRPPVPPISRLDSQPALPGQEHFWPVTAQAPFDGPSPGSYISRDYTLSSAYS